jgi:hypothetical protein
MKEWTNLDNAHNRNRALSGVMSKSSNQGIRAISDWKKGLRWEEGSVMGMTVAE